MLIARSGYIHLAEALRKAWRVFYPDEPDRQMPIREVEEIEAPPLHSGEEIRRHIKKVRTRLQTALADGKLVSVAWSGNGERYDVGIKYWRFSPSSPLTNDDADTIETGYLKPLKGNVPALLWHEPCFVEREAFATWLENEREGQPSAEWMNKAAAPPPTQGHVADDKQLVHEMDELIKSEKLKVRAAAKRLQDQTWGASPQAKEDRLRKLYAKMKKDGIFGS